MAAWVRFACWDFGEGLCAVTVRIEQPSVGYVDLKGELVIPPSFEFGGRFREGFAAVELKGKWGFIDRTGHYAVRPAYDDASGFGGGLAAVCERGVYRYVDAGGRPAFGKTFSMANPFVNGLARVGVE